MKHLNEYITEKLRINSKTESKIIPINKKELKEILKERLQKDKNANFNDIDVSNVKDMDNLFVGLNARNIDISEWDVSNVESMIEMFDNCRKFNCDLSKWNVSKVKRFSGMFKGCEDFNSDLSNWDVSSCEDNMHDMFYMCISMKNIPSWYKG